MIYIYFSILLSNNNVVVCRFLPVTEPGKVLAFCKCSLRSNRPRRLSGLLSSSGVWGLEEGLVLPLLSVGLISAACKGVVTAGSGSCGAVGKGGTGALTLSLSLVCFSASLLSLWLRRSSRFCCCSLKPFCFCRARVIHKGPASLSWTFGLSRECLLWRDGFSARGHTKTPKHTLQRRVKAGWASLSVQLRIESGVFMIKYWFIFFSYLLTKPHFWVKMIFFTQNVLKKKQMCNFLK